MKTKIIKTTAAIKLAASILALVTFQTFAQSDAPRFHALVLTERGGIHGPFVVAALEWLKATATNDNFAMDVVNNPDKFTKPFLAKYQVIIQLNYPPYRWSDEAKAAFQDYIEQGRGGWVGLHHATLLGEFDGYPMWQWFSDFMGGIRFKTYIAKRVSGTVVVEDAAHPAMKGLPSTFVIDEEEWYTYNKDPRPMCMFWRMWMKRLIIRRPTLKWEDHPVIWTNEKMKARNIYIIMGHHPTLLKNDNYKILLRNAILWAAGTQTNSVTN